MQSILPREHVFERTILISVPLWTNSGVGASINATAGSGFGLAFEFSLTNVLMNVGNGSVSASLNYAYANSAEFTTLFDSFKILNNKLRMMFTNNNSSLNSPATALPEFMAVSDTDDSIPPLSTDIINQYQRIQIKQLGQPNDPLLRTIYPKPLIQTYRTLISTGYSNPTKPIWIDMTTADVPHYGLKMEYNQYSNNTSSDTKIGKIDMYFTQRFSCKCVR